MNKDLIDRNALLDEIYGDNRPEVYDGLDIANWCMECINTALSVEAEPVRHGGWVQQSQCAFTCSECGVTVGMPTDARALKVADVWNYCPKCGARMDKDKNSKG